MQHRYSEEAGRKECETATHESIFIGGNILDRGITIPSLIAFYYGRNPRTMQADTVLQHSRMYGNRDRRDLAVTRFHTSRDVYDRLYTINAFENTLREAFENGVHERGVVFIQSDTTNGVRPCAPSKVLLSNVVAIGSNGIYLPTNFQTRSGPDMVKVHRDIGELIPDEARDKRAFFEIDGETALRIIALAQKTMEFPNHKFEWDAMRGLLEYYSGVKKLGDGRVLLMVETGRKLHREKSGDRTGLSILGSEDLRRLVLDPNRLKPALILLEQEGTKALGWSGQRFWWPMLAAPGTVEPCVFATKVASK